MIDSAGKSNPSFSRASGHVQAIYRGHMIAGSDNAVISRDEGQDPVVYFPREDVMMSVLNPADFTTTSEAHGTAKYYTILRDGQFAERGAWTFEQPSASSVEIGGMIAFDPKVVTITGAAPESDSMWQREQKQAMSDYIRHTDSGSGLSQASHWEPTVSQPGDDL